MRNRSLPRGLAQAGALASAILTAQTAVNIRQVRSLDDEACTAPGERVSILLPVRDEVHRVEPSLRALLGQQGIADLEILVLDDGSTDGTADLLREIVAADPRARILSGADVDPPDGWRGKTWACHRLAAAATGRILVFVDADVTLRPHAVAAATRALRDGGWSLVSPYPRQLAGSLAERITQPMVTWSWIATLPMALAATRRPMWAAAIGQFLVVDAAAYRESGGHESVRGHVVEDVAVLRELKRHGHRGMPMDGSRIAECRMYVGAHEVYEGYCKSLWSVFGSTVGAAGAVGAMALIYVLPPIIALTSRDAAARRWGALGYLTAVTGRAIVARRTGERVHPDVLAHPLSIGAFAALTVASTIRHRCGDLRWKGRAV